MAFYANLATTAARLIRQFGQSATLSRTVDGEFDPALGGPGPGTTTTKTASVVVTDYALRDIDGTVIQQADRKAILEVEFFEPKAGDTLTVGSDTYTVMNAAILSPGGTAVIYTLQVRK